MTTKIVNNLPKSRKVPFEDIELGHFFLDADGDLCIRTGPVKDPNNAFYLEEGGFIDMEPCDMVTPVHVTINIDGYEI